jgi:hypothetical protein
MTVVFGEDNPMCCWVCRSTTPGYPDGVDPAWQAKHYPGPAEHQPRSSPPTISAKVRATHQTAAGLLVTPKSVSRLWQFEHLQRNSISGVSPRPPATNAARSACWLRRQLRHDTSTATWRARSVVRGVGSSEVRAHLPSPAASQPTTGLRARRPVSAAGRRAAFTVPSTTVVASGRRTFSSGMALAAA